MKHLFSKLALASAIACLAAPVALAQDDVADIPSRDLTVGEDENKRYFLIGPRKDAKAPKEGFGLVVILPGGPGTANFHPFVKRIYKNSVPEDYVVAQPVAVKWTDDQGVIWPTAGVKAEGMKFTTEEFVESVIGDVAAKHKLDPKKVFTLSWSSSGPAAYAASLTSRKITGSFVAMSVYKPNELPDLKKARGHAYYLYHSEDDRLCPYRMAEAAEKDLKESGAKVKLQTYDGGHGWRGPLWDDIREGLEWLEKNHAAREDAIPEVIPSEKSPQAPPVAAPSPQTYLPLPPMPVRLPRTCLPRLRCLEMRAFRVQPPASFPYPILRRGRSR